MSTGKTHKKASLILASGFSLGAIIISSPEMIQCATGALIGVVTSGDWDVDKKFIGNRIIKKRLGAFAEKVFDTWLRPYKTSFKHGSFGSHFPIYGTHGRLFYVFFTIIIPFYAIYSLILLSFNYHINLINELTWWVRIMFVSWYTFGLCVSDTIHYFLDVFTVNAE